MTWIEPLQLETWFINVFAGSREIFTPLAIFTILGLAGYFRMNGLTMGFMLFMFLLMFSGFVTPSLFIFVAIIGGVLVGYSASKIIKG